MTARPTRLVVSIAALTAVACVKRVDTVPDLPKPAPVAAAEPPKGGAQTAPDRTIRFDEIEIIGSVTADTSISELNDEELWAIGVAAVEAGDNAKAAAHFERLADFFPNSPRRPAALHRAGLVLERMKDHAGALARFDEAAKAYGETADGAESQFEVADQFYFLGEFDRAQAVLETLTEAPWIPAKRRVEAEAKRGVCLLYGKRLPEAEKVLRKAVETMKEDLAEELRESTLPSLAQFYLAEVYREYFRNAPIDPAKSTQEQLISDLEYKAQMLLSAQGHYLRAIRLGHPEWATASGFRIGELYQALHQQLVDSSAPADLTGDEAAVYREELRTKVKVLVTKAIDAYEKTLAAAERLGATNPFVAQTRTELDRMKALMLGDDATAQNPATPASEAAPTTTAPPAEAAPAATPTTGS